MGMFLNGLIKCDTSREEYVKLCVINELIVFITHKKRISFSAFTPTQEIYHR